MTWFLMSQQLISRSPDLTRLQEEGYEVGVHGSYLVISGVPYLSSSMAVERGQIVCALELANDQTVQPGDHTVLFRGEHPHDSQGVPLRIVASDAQQDLGDGLIVQFTFSRKPKGDTERYGDYYEKVVTYVEFLGKHARAVDTSATARTYKHIATEDGESVFRYRDNASARANIQAVTDKFKTVSSVAIVGLGGTGAYILDLVAKTPVGKIHLFDGDRFSQHNAFRAPGAPAGTDLDGAPLKVDYYFGIYDRMRTGIQTHADYVTEENVGQLADMDFVFVSVDDGPARRLIVDVLEANAIPFVDVGMGIYEQDAMLGGHLRITSGVEGGYDQVRKRLPLNDPGPADEYRTNIQIADLNSLNAVLAVIKWKKLVGFYQDTDREQHAVYAIGGNRLVNQEHNDEPA